MKKYVKIMLVLFILQSSELFSISDSIGERIRYGAQGIVEGSLATLSGAIALSIASELKRPHYSLPILRLQVYSRVDAETLCDSLIALSALAAVGYTTWTLGYSSQRSLKKFFAHHASSLQRRTFSHEVAIEGKL